MQRPAAPRFLSQVHPFLREEVNLRRTNPHSPDLRSGCLFPVAGGLRCRAVCPCTPRGAAGEPRLWLLPAGPLFCVGRLQVP